MIQAPSIKSLLTAFQDITPRTAKTIRGVIKGEIDPVDFKSVSVWVSKCYNMPMKSEMKMEALNELIGGYGVEAVFGDSGMVLLTYVNLGGTYITTIVRYDRKYLLTSWGDMIEWLERRGVAVQ